MINIKKNKSIAITGSLASGKTTLLSMISDLGYATFSSDNFVKSLYKRDEIVKMMSVLFPNSITADGDINQKLILRECFLNPEKMKMLEEFFHPMVLQEIKMLIDKNNVTIFEIPLLFEVKWHNIFDCIICVTAESKTRMERFCKKGYSENDFISIEKMQMPQDKKAKMSNIIIDNTNGISPKDLDIVLKAIS